MKTKIISAVILINLLTVSCSKNRQTVSSNDSPAIQKIKISKDGIKLEGSSLSLINSLKIRTPRGEDYPINIASSNGSILNGTISKKITMVSGELFSLIISTASGDSIINSSFILDGALSGLNVQDGQTIVWDSNLNQWAPKDTIPDSQRFIGGLDASSPNNLNGSGFNSGDYYVVSDSGSLSLNNTVEQMLYAGDKILWDGHIWIRIPGSSAATISKLNDIPNVSKITPLEGSSLVYDSTLKKWVPGFPTGQAVVVTDSSIADNSISSSKINGLDSRINNATNGMEPAIVNPRDEAKYYRGDKTFQRLSTTVVPEGTNRYYKDSNVKDYLVAITNNASTPGKVLGLDSSGALVWSTFTNGVNGDIGPQGPAGANGIQGPVGATGPQGLQGPAGVPGVDGANGINGSNGSNGKSAYDLAVLNNFIGTQDQWLASLVGATGSQGIQGATGAQGPKGDTGPTGANGLQGVQGLTGDAGPQGAKGDNGSIGLQGLKGDTGSQGPQGIQGDPGMIGLTGINGLDGKSAYTIATDSGYTGTQTEWLLSLKGSDGANGLPGSTGVKGDAGAIGPQGPTGPQGVIGLTGETGPQGIQGLQGEPGIGLTGINGLDGKSAYTIATDLGYIGTQTEWLLSLKGQDGAQGPAGAKGDTGLQGLQGTDGLIGAQGPQGIPGTVGPAGPQGLTGADGLAGTQGPKGDPGVIGLTGLTGPKGDTGVQGEPGAAGIAGLNGKSAYEVAVALGYSGTQAEWLLSLKGLQGETGLKGDKGDKGDTGAAGSFIGLNNFVVITDATGALANSTISTSKLNFLNDVTSDIQSQLNSKQSNSLALANILVGQLDGKSSSVAVSGDVTLTSAGVMNLIPSGVSAGSYSLVSVDSKGIVKSGSKPTTLVDLGITESVVNSISVSAPLSLSAVFPSNTPNIILTKADALNDGYLSFVDWLKFDKKIDSTNGVSTTDLTVNGQTIGQGFYLYSSPEDPSRNTIHGVNSLSSNTEGVANSAFGYETLALNDTGFFNTAIGDSSLHANTTGYQNTATGGSSLSFNTTGSDNTSDGFGALYGSTTGNKNTAIGGLAGANNISGSNNTYIGYNAGSRALGSGNVVLGSNDGLALGSNDNNIIISDGVGVIRLQVNSTGDTGVGMSPNAAYKLSVAGAINANGLVYSSGSQLTSDERLKKDIKLVPGSLEKLTRLNGVEYNWNHSFHPELNLGDRPQMGVLAQQVEKVFPAAVSTDPKGIKSVAYNMLIAPIIEAIKELKKMFMKHDTELAELKKENREMKDYICLSAKTKPSFCKR